MAQKHEQAALALLEAEAKRQQIGLISKLHPDWTIKDAYAVQKAVVTGKLASGRRAIGWKIGLTSRAMQNSLNIDVPDSGVLFDDMVFESGGIVPQKRFIQPRVEAEIAFLIGSDLTGARMARRDVLAATAAVAPSLEILDTRIVRADPQTGAMRTIVDTVADNAANAGIVLGEPRHQPGAFDLRWVGAIVKRNDEVEETGLGAGVLNDPFEGIIWLANRLAEHGGEMRAGDIVLSGSFIRAIEARSGDRFQADFGPFGSVSIAFA